jgi:hypothetical protein
MAPVVTSRVSVIAIVPVTSMKIMSLLLPGPHPLIGAEPPLLCAMMASGRLHAVATCVFPEVVLTKILLARVNPEVATNRNGNRMPRAGTADSTVPFGPFPSRRVCKFFSAWKR